MFVMTHMFFPQVSDMFFFFRMPLCLPKLYCTLFFCMRSVPANGWHICGQVTKTFQGVTSECFRSGNNDETTKNVLDLSLWSICILIRMGSMIFGIRTFTKNPRRWFLTFSMRQAVLCYSNMLEIMYTIVATQVGSKDIDLVRKGREPREVWIESLQKRELRSYPHVSK